MSTMPRLALFALVPCLFLQGCQQKARGPQLLAQFQEGMPSPTQELWAEKCKDIPKDAVSIQVQMGKVLDTFRPKPGVSWCEMLTAKDQHQWRNPATREWVTPEYDTKSGDLGGSAVDWPRDQGPEYDQRRRLSVWGTVSGAELGCCASSYDEKDPGTDEYTHAFSVFYLRATDQPVLIASVSQLTPAPTKDLWAEKCKGVPGDASSILVQMGKTVDMFKPKLGTSWCAMLAANDLHQWRDPVTLEWVTPEYDANSGDLGGSAVDWPKDHGPSFDLRRRLSVWGSEGGAGLGCCASRYDENSGEDQYTYPFSVFYLPAPEEPAAGSEQEAELKTSAGGERGPPSLRLIAACFAMCAVAAFALGWGLARRCASAPAAPEHRVMLSGAEEAGA